MKLHSDKFDLSDYDPNGRFGDLYSEENKKVRGLMKVVCSKTGVIVEYVFVKSKMYAYVTDSFKYKLDADSNPTKEKVAVGEMKAKGIPKAFMKQEQK